MPRGPAQLVHRQPVPALVARAGVPPAPACGPGTRSTCRGRSPYPAWSAGALRPAGSARASSARCAAGCSRWAPRLADEGLVVVEVLAGRPQAQVGVVVLPRPGQLPVRAREQRVGPRSAPVRARAPPSAASVICCRCLAQLAILFLRGQFFFGWRILPDTCTYGRELFTRFCAEKMLLLQGVHVCTAWSNISFCTIFRMA